MTPSGVPDAPHTLITGGAGFIGSHLAERLLGQGERVVVIDDFSTGSRDNLALAKRVIELTGSASEIELVPYDEAYDDGFEDMQRRKPGVDKLEAFTGFRPSTPLDEIVRSTAGLA